LEFEWDTRKAARNVAKHGVPFEYATRAFLDPRRLDIEDYRRDYGEQRRVTLGRIDGRVFAIAYTPPRRHDSSDFRTEGERAREEAI